MALKRPLRRLFFLLREVGCWMASSTVSLASDSSGMVAVVVNVFRLFDSPVFSLCLFFLSLGGDDDSRCCCADTTHDFLRSLVRDRTGEPPGDSRCFTVSVRPRSVFRSCFGSGLGSTDESLLLLVKERNREERRVSVGGLSVCICRPGASGASSEEGLDPPDRLPEVLSSLLRSSASSSSPPSSSSLFFDSATGASGSNSLTWGKYV